MTRFFKPPADYIMPADFEMSRELAKAGLLAEKDLFHDLIARNAGGEIVRDVVSDDYSPRDFVNAFDLGSVVGNTPMTRAINLLTALYDVGKVEEDPNGTPTKGGNALTKKSVSNKSGKLKFARPEKTAEQLQKEMERIKELSPEEVAVLGNSVREIVQTQLLHKSFLKVSKKLAQFDKFSVRPGRKVEPDREGDEIRYRNIRSGNELSRAVKKFWGLPPACQDMQLETKAVLVKERVRREDKKPLLYVMLDISGSMKDGERRSKAFAVVVNRLTAVARGDGELVIRLFDERLRGRIDAVDAVTAKSAWGLVKSLSFSGSGTAIEACMRQALKDIDKIVKENPNKFLGTRHDLVVVTDGLDEVTMNLDELEGIKLHAFICDGKNDNLVRLAEKTGGVGVSEF